MNLSGKTRNEDTNIYRITLTLYLMLVMVSAQAQWTTALPSGILVGENMNNRFLFFGNSEKTYEPPFPNDEWPCPERRRYREYYSNR